MAGPFDDDPPAAKPANSGRRATRKTPKDAVQGTGHQVGNPAKSGFDKPKETVPDPSLVELAASPPVVKPAAVIRPSVSRRSSSADIESQTESKHESAPVYSVAQVNSLIQRAIATRLPGAILVQAEISNFSVYGKGHAFFKLKDAHAEIPCMMWRDTLERLRFKPQDGMAVLAEGTVKLYEPQGRVNFYVSRLLPRGAGELELAFRQLCEKLRGEGLFDAARKRRLPLLPQRIVIITSPTGDVIHDVLTTAWRRFGGLHVLVYPVRVQGAGAAREIAQAIGQINAHAAELAVDLILLVRGGGSLEDLWAFNEEIVARAIFASGLPIATGIGHEPDTTIADLVADLRGPTPTGVTELTIPDVRILLRQCGTHADTMRHAVASALLHGDKDLRVAAGELAGEFHALIRDRQRRIDELAMRIAGIEPRHAVAQGWRRLEDAQRRLRTAPQRDLQRSIRRLAAMKERLERKSPRILLAQCGMRLSPVGRQLAAGMQLSLKSRQAILESARQRLELIGPQAVLKRGYSITTDAAGRVLLSVKQITPGESLTTRLADGKIQSQNARLFERD